MVKVKILFLINYRFIIACLCKIKYKNCVVSEEMKVRPGLLNIKIS